MLYCCQEFAVTMTTDGRPAFLSCLKKNLHVNKTPKAKCWFVRSDGDDMLEFEEIAAYALQRMGTIASHNFECEFCF